MEMTCIFVSPELEDRWTKGEKYNGSHYEGGLKLNYCFTVEARDKSKHTTAMLFDGMVMYQIDTVDKSVGALFIMDMKFLDEAESEEDFYGKGNVEAPSKNSLGRLIGVLEEMPEAIQHIDIEAVRDHGANLGIPTAEQVRAVHGIPAPAEDELI